MRDVRRFFVVQSRVASKHLDGPWTDNEKVYVEPYDAIRFRDQFMGALRGEDIGADPITIKMCETFVEIAKAVGGTFETRIIRRTVVDEMFEEAEKSHG